MTVNLTILTDLRNENSRLKQVIQDLHSSAIEIPSFLLTLRLSPQESAILGLLLKREIVTREALETIIQQMVIKTLIYSHNSTRVLIHRLRRKLAKHEIELKCRWGIGYYIPKEQKAWLK